MLRLYFFQVATYTLLALELLCGLSFVVGCVFVGLAAIR